jgi:elongator complex protein 3
VRRHPKDGRGLFSKGEIIAGFRRFAPEHGWASLETDFVARLRMRPVRTLSGVTPVTVLTKPYPCPGKCIFCPSDLRMPKSYLADEPGAQRAETNGFDPYLQTWNRLKAYREIGHPVDKVELIILGGTWSFHPEAFQIWTVKRCFDALNDFGRGIDRRGEAGGSRIDYRRLERAEGSRRETTYNRSVSRFLAGELSGALLHPAERCGWKALERAQRENERAPSRCVGLAVETRPDHLCEAEVLRIRRLGATKVQIGVQSLSDRVLALNRRGHDVAATRRAFRLLRRAGFKIHAHWMANLRGATPKSDVEDFARLFDDAGFRPDELKVYPCSLVESAELMGYYERGAWRPYDGDELLGVVTECLARTPEYCRLTRVIRDFSAADIVAGNKTANLREVAERRLRTDRRPCRDIRSREIRAGRFDAEALRSGAISYATSAGREIFLHRTTPEDKLVAFLRLLLPTGSGFVDELRGSALVREVHVYGASLAIGRRADGEAQHLGLGRRLIDRAAELARDAGFRDLAVISAVGTRAYYRSLGFRDGALYQHLTV